VTLKAANIDHTCHQHSTHVISHQNECMSFVHMEVLPYVYTRAVTHKIKLTEDAISDVRSNKLLYCCEIMT